MCRTHVRYWKKGENPLYLKAQSLLNIKGPKASAKPTGLHQSQGGPLFTAQQSGGLGGLRCATGSHRECEAGGSRVVRRLENDQRVVLAEGIAACWNFASHGLDRRSYRLDSILWLPDLCRY